MPSKIAPSAAQQSTATYHRHMDSHDALAKYAVIAAIAGAIGLAGAWAFNPDDGAIAHVDALWTVFGIMVYVGAFLAFALFLGAAVVWTGTKARRHRHR